MLVIGMSCVAYRSLCSIFTKRCITFLGKYNVCAQKGSTSLEKNALFHLNVLVNAIKIL